MYQLRILGKGVLVMPKNLMERTEKDWLDWLTAEVPDLIHQPIVLKKQYPREFRRVLQVVGNWVTVESKLKRYRTGKYRPTEILSEELKAMECEVPSDEGTTENKEVRNSGQSGHGKSCEQEGSKTPRRTTAAARLLSVKKIEGDFKMPEPNPRYARTKYSEIYNAKPYASVKQTTRIVKEDEKMDESRKMDVVPKAETLGKEPNQDNANELTKKPRKTRVNMTEAEMREFVLEAMKTLGERPSKVAYEAYAREHGGVTAHSLVNHGLGIARWSKIAAEERARLAKEAEPAEEPIAMPEETPVAAERAEKPTELEPEKARQPEEREKDLLEVLQVLIHGIDATVTIGGLEMQVRLDFGPKK